MMINRIPRPPHATTREQHGIFSVVSQLATERGKATRHILIFDNHPATLHLLRRLDLLRQRKSELGYKVFAIALILAAGIGTIWNLLQVKIFPQLLQFADIALFLVRLMVGIIFLTSGWKHVREPEMRSKDIGMSKGFTVFLGVAEVAGALGLIFGDLAQLAAIALILVMLGAIEKKIFVWHTGFWGSAGTNGWSYDLMIIVMNLVIVTTGGGNISVAAVT